MKKKNIKLNRPLKSSDIPATAGMLSAMEDRLIHRMDAKFAHIDSQFPEVLSEIRRLGVLMEEQNARNLYVLDGYAQIYDLIEQRK